MAKKKKGRRKKRRGAHGSHHVAHAPHLTVEGPLPQKDKVDTEPPPPSPFQPAQPVPLLRKGSTWFIGAIGLVAAIATLYQMRTILVASVSVAPNFTPNTVSPFPVMLSIFNAGHLESKGIEVKWLNRKIVFVNGDTVILNTTNSPIPFALMASQLPPGDTTTARIGQAVHLFTRKDSGVTVIGDPCGEGAAAGKAVAKGAITAYLIHSHPFVESGQIVLFGSEGCSHLFGTVEQRVSFVDAIVPIKYSRWLIPLKRTRVFRFFAEPTSRNSYTWTPATPSEPDRVESKGEVLYITDEKPTPESLPSFRTFTTPPN
jgi:hypothetical protein